MGNIIGSNMDTWAVNQIKLRQRLLGANPRDSRVLSWINNRTAWIRTSSPVEVSENKSKDLTGTPGFAGRQLAKEFVLFNGTSGLRENTPGQSELGFTPIQKAGVTNNNTVINNFAYGFGGNTPQGIVPMPGIESLNITTYSRGALRKAELKLKVHNKYQFGIIDSLYMKPGYTILIEWGNTIYYTGTSENPQPRTPDFNTKAFRNFFSSKGTTQEALLSNIRDDRQATEGNYDGFYGSITNFSWTYNIDGSYDITISAISIGDVIESLNINRVLIEDKPQPVIKTPPPPTNNSNLQTLTGQTKNGVPFFREFNVAEAKKYKEYWISLGKDQTTAVAEAKKAGGPLVLVPPPNRVETEEKIITALLDDKDRSDFNKFLYESVYNYIINNINKNGQEVLTSSNSPTKNKIKTFASSLEGELNYSSDGKDIVGISTKVALNTTNFQGEVVGNTTRSSRNFPFIYIKLGSLLKYIEKKLLIVTDNSSTSPNEPLIKFDLTPENYCFTFPLQYSLNPNVCVIPFSVAESNDTEIKRNLNIKEAFYSIEARYWENILGTSFRNENSKYVGNLYDIHVNIHYIASLLKSCTTNNSLPLLRFLETLMNGIQSSLGSLNKFTVSYEHDTNRIKIYDDIPLDKNFLAKLDPPIKDTPESVATFNILGYSRNILEGSFIQNVNLTTTISSQLASMISIGAQAQTPSDITNATGFMKFNEGLKDSIIPTKVSVVAAQQQVKDNPEKSMAKFYTKLKAKGGIINDLYLQGITPTSEMIDSQQTNAAIIFRSLTSQFSIDEDIPTQSFIPFNLSLQMDGFSGAKIYEKFTINSEILPPGYPDVLNFVIKGLNHNISNEGWTTNIESLTLAR